MIPISMVMCTRDNLTHEHWQKAFVIYGDLDTYRGTVTIFKNRFGNELGVFSIERFKEIVEARVGPDYLLKLK